VNVANTESKKLKGIIEEYKLNWRSFAMNEKITADWSSPGTPLYYVIDPKGMIRHKWTGYPGEQTLETTLQKMIKEIEDNSKK
jgi:hypothetical protein